MSCFQVPASNPAKNGDCSSYKCWWKQSPGWRGGSWKVLKLMRDLVTNTAFTVYIYIGLVRSWVLYWYSKKSCWDFNCYNTTASCLLSFRVHFFGVIWIRISGYRSLGSWCIKWADESVTRVDSSYSSLMYNDLNEFGSLILMHITPKERILKFKKQMSVVVMTGLDPDHLEGTHSYWNSIIV